MGFPQGEGHLITGFVSALAFFAATLFVLRKLHRIVLVQRITPIASLFLLYLAYRVFRLFYQFPLSSQSDQYLRVVSLFLEIFLIVLALESLIVDYVGSLRKKARPPSLLRSIILWIIAVILLLVLLKAVLRVNLGPVLFTSAAVTVVVGLALQDLLSNLIAGITLNISRPFRMGDWIEVGSVTGEVVNMTWRETGLRTLDGDIVIIPNTTISKEMIVNESSGSEAEARHIKVGVSYDTAPNTVKKVMAEAALQAAGVVNDPAPDVRLLDFGDSAVIYDMKMWIDRFEHHDQIESDVRTRIWYAFKRHGIQIPFPIRSVYVRSIPVEEEALAREKDLADKVAVMRPVEILQTLNDEELARLAAQVGWQHFGKGEVLVRQGEAGDSFFIITSGRVAVSLGSGQGTPATVANIDAGGFFGEGSLLTGEPRTATITAAEDTRVLVIDKPAFAGILARNPSIVEGLSRILENRLADLARKRAEAQAAEQAVPAEPFAVILKKIKKFFGI